MIFFLFSFGSPLILELFAEQEFVQVGPEFRQGVEEAARQSVVCSALLLLLFQGVVFVR